MKRLETREHLIVYCDSCGQECNGSLTIFGAGTESESHACDRLSADDKPACKNEIERRRSEQARALRSLNTN